MSSPDTIDVLIVGGGPAGLSAALYLGRARRSVWVVDAGQPRHAVSEGVHNFLTRDGLPPAALREEAWAQMKPYTSVRAYSARVEGLEGPSDASQSWRAHLSDGVHVRARAVLLATGVIDEHPKIPGFQEKWGHSIHHCPYCHGFELRDRPLALLAEGEMIQHMAPLLLNWSQDLVVLSHGQRLDGEVQDELRKREIPLHSAPVTSLEGPGRELARIRLEDGTTIERAGLFVQAKQRQVPLVAGLDLTLDEHGFVAVDAMASTGRPMLWAAGDLTSRFQQVVMAASQGAVAAGAINGALSAR